MNNDHPLVSVIISTRNEELVIESLLKSLRSQTYPHIEIVLVDNHSTDRTAELARAYVDKLVITGPERSVQRNRGVQESSGDYVLILDADMQVTPRVVEEAVDCVKKNPTIKAVIIPEMSVGQNYWARCKALERNCYIDNLDDVAAARFYEKELFLQEGGFNEEMTGTEDWDLSQRIGHVTNIGAIQSVILHNEGLIHLPDQIRKKYYYARTMRSYLMRHPAAFLRQANFLFRPAFFLHWRDFVKNPSLTLGMIFLRLCEGLASAAGTLRGLIR